MDQLPPQRLLTIIGPGGIGKTSVALAVAEALLATYDHGIRPIELSPLPDPRLVSTVPAATLDLEIGSDNALPGLVVAANPGDSSTAKWSQRGLELPVPQCRGLPRTRAAR